MRQVGDGVVMLRPGTERIGALRPPGSMVDIRVIKSKINAAQACVRAGAKAIDAATSPSAPILRIPLTGVI